MSEPELLAWIDTAAKLINPKHRGVSTEKTTHVQSLRRRKPKPRKKKTP